MDIHTQIHGAKAYVAEFTNKHAQQEVIEENNNPQAFVPASGTRHKPLKRKSIEGTIVNKKRLKKGRKNVYKIMHVGLRRQLPEAESILTEENMDVPFDCSPSCHQEPPKENFQMLSFLLGKVKEIAMVARGNFKKEMPIPILFHF